MKTLLIFITLLTSSLSQAKVIGSDDLSPMNSMGLNLPPALFRLVDAMGLLSMGCTGTHIGRGFVITAAHCITERDHLPFVENQPCADVTIQWGVRGDRRGRVSRCMRVAAAQLDTIVDFAILQFDRAPAAFVEMDINSMIPTGQRLTILSHPESEPLQWSKYCRRILPVRPGNPAWGQPGTNVRVLYHQCDTRPGSSGATILDARTLKIVGIHNGGDKGFNYGTPLSNMPWARIFSTMNVFSRPQ